MVDNAQVRSLIAMARGRGAIIETHVDDERQITHVRVLSGIPGVGPGWMPVIQASERLRAFLAGPSEAPNWIALAAVGVCEELLKHGVDLHSSLFGAIEAGIRHYAPADAQPPRSEA